MSNTVESDITDVLKALNHEIRREIIRILHNTYPVAYSVFLDQLNLPASSNVAYHLSLLNKAQLVDKDKNGKYYLTQLGRRSALLLDLASESKSSPFSDLYLGFSQLTPFETLLGTWWIFFLVIGLLTIPSAVFIGVIFLSLSIASLILIVYRTKVIWSLFFLNNFLWVFFAPEKRSLLFLIIITNVFGLFLIFPEMNTQIIGDLEELIGLLIILISILLSLYYLYSTLEFSFWPMRKKKEKEGET